MRQTRTILDHAKAMNHDMRIEEHFPVTNDGGGERVTCWTCETEIPRAEAVVVYRDEQGVVQDRPGGHGLWLAEYLCLECAESAERLAADTAPADDG